MKNCKVTKSNAFLDNANLTKTGFQKKKNSSSTLSILSIQIKRRSPEPLFFYQVTLGIVSKVGFKKICLTGDKIHLNYKLEFISISST